MDFQPFGEGEDTRDQDGNGLKSIDHVTQCDAFVLDGHNFILGLRKQVLQALSEEDQDCLKTMEADLAFDLRIK
jgi:hypothetical protein